MQATSINLGSTRKHASLVLIAAIALGLAQPGLAGMHRAHRSASANPVAAGSDHPGSDHVVAGSGDNGSAIHAGGWVGNGSGGATHYSGGAFHGANGASGARVSYTGTDGNGNASHKGAHGVAGADGSYDKGHNSWTRNADGTGSASWQNSGRGANGGAVDSAGNYTRGSDGRRTGASQTTATGARGNYSGSTSVDDGSGSHDTTYRNADGDTYNGQTTWNQDHGYTHSGTCTDAQGNVIACGK